MVPHLHPITDRMNRIKSRSKDLARAQLPTCESHAVHEHFRKPVRNNGQRRKWQSKDRKLQERRREVDSVVGEGLGPEVKAAFLWWISA